MDDDMQAMEVRDREIEFRLEAFARARLSPDPQAIARSRARVMREARLRIDGTAGAARSAPAVATIPRRSMVRRVAMPLLAAGVWLAIAVGTISAAQPGGPLYGTRLWAENLTQPAGGAARAAVELQRLESRLDEALAAAARGDAGAVQAALDAYRRIADETIAGTHGDVTHEALIAAALDQHAVVLTAVADQLALKGNATAAAAVEASVERAIVHNQAVIDRIGDNVRGGAGGTGGTSGPGAGSSGGSSGGLPGGSLGGGGTGVGPAPTTSPTEGAPTGGGVGPGTEPTTTGTPDKTPKPARTPRVTPDPPPGPEQPDRGQGDQDE
jgi:uncharacterized membrane protein YgcG